ncbi:lanthionine synthetase C family protein [Streptomyces sp. BI20]|uniref:lanthionine synthetase C family protein n=1 Tax=Streptomyces sp. BI20 TaxID=3403460 RepID=UPI003C7418E6
MITDLPTTPLRPGWGQSLAQGAAGVALLHVERARGGRGGWPTAQAWLAKAATDVISGADSAGLYFGAPALAFVVRAAAADEPGRYARALARLDTATVAITRRRLDAAHSRIDAGRRPRLGEFDLIYGLTGLGAGLLTGGTAQHDLLREVLGYLVRLTEPVAGLPGWWTANDPSDSPSAEFPGGHGNFGMAHGVGGPLALLAITARRGVVVPGHLDAIRTICRWFDVWCQPSPTGPWWPEWITLHEHGTGRPRAERPGRPSWCYGTPGLARAQQLAALALTDPTRQAMAEGALVGALIDPVQRGAITDHSLCHGTTGLLHTAWRMSLDAPGSTIAGLLPELRASCRTAAGPGFLEGGTGSVLALDVQDTGLPPTTAWDTCLLVN